MATQVVTLRLPESIYQSARRTARAVKRPVKEVLLKVLTSSLPSLDGLPSGIVRELTALEELADKQLSAVARSTLPALQRQQLNRLLEKNQAGTLDDRERQALEELISKSERLMLRKARACVLLKWRGYAPAAIIERRTLK